MKKHQSTIGKSDEYCTPPEIIKALGGWESFDLDPADARTSAFRTARNRFCEGGLESEWFGRVWLNPPFNRYQRPKWMAKMAEHNNGIMLVPAACETDAFYKYVWGKASGILFLKGRPHFYKITGERYRANSGCTICLVSYGDENLLSLQNSGLGVTVNDLDVYHSHTEILIRDTVRKTHQIIELEKNIHPSAR